jgi:hypothetical protein
VISFSLLKDNSGHHVVNRGQSAEVEAGRPVESLNMNPELR